MRESFFSAMHLETIKVTFIEVRSIYMYVSKEIQSSGNKNMHMYNFKTVAHIRQIFTHRQIAFQALKLDVLSKRKYSMHFNCSLCCIYQKCSARSMCPVATRIC